MKAAGATTFIFFEQRLYVYFIQHLVYYPYRMPLRYQLIQRWWEQHCLVLVVSFKSYAQYTFCHTIPDKKLNPLIALLSHKIYLHPFVYKAILKIENKKRLPTFETASFRSCLKMIS